LQPEQLSEIMRVTPRNGSWQGPGYCKGCSGDGSPWVVQKQLKKSSINSRRADSRKDRGEWCPTEGCKWRTAYTLSAVDASAWTVSLHLLGKNPAIEHLPVAKDAKISVGGKPGKLTELKAGMALASVRLGLEDGKLAVMEISAKAERQE